MTKHIRLVFFLVFFIGVGCNNSRKADSSISRAFYYWKATFHISPMEKEVLTSLKVNKIYLKFFDVDWNETSSQPMPTAKVVIKDSLHWVEIIPVVYITNKTFLQLNDIAIKDLADNVFKSSKEILEQHNSKIKEFQIDCDWTEKTREKYFQFLRHLKFLLPDKLISSTIRLHQIKYHKITGIPPVDRGMLMFYNMGKLDAYSNRNSIFNEEDARKYLANIKQYPLALDVVLPIFSWYIHMRNNKIIELISKDEIIDFETKENFVKDENNHLLATNSFFCKGRYIRKGDFLKKEDISDELLVSAGKMIAKELKEDKRSISLFDLDSVNILRYEKETFEEVFDFFN